MQSISIQRIEMHEMQSIEMHNESEWAWDRRDIEMQEHRECKREGVLGDSRGSRSRVSEWGLGL